MGALAMFSIFIIVQVAYSCIPALQPPSNSEPPTEEPTKAPTTAQKETTKKPDVCVTVELNPGRTCVFPFTYQYHQHYECIPFKDKFWCALTPIYDKKEWGYCDEAVCPPTAKPIEEPGVSSGTGSTTTTTTTTTTMAEAWETGSTTVTINLLNCEVDFNYSFQQGIKFKDVSSLCSGQIDGGSSAEMILNFGNHTFEVTDKSGISFSCSVLAVLIDENLSGEVLDKTLKCKAKNDQCQTVDGPDYPGKCKIPFIKDGRKYSGCTNIGSPDSSRIWCPTEVKPNLEAVKGKWGYCSSRCGFCAGNDIQQRQQKTSKCGYDCLVNLQKEMKPKSSEADPFVLGAPELLDPNQKMTNWNKVTDTQFQFLKGQPGVYLKCLNGFDHFPCQQSIFVNCTGNYRFSVYSATLDPTSVRIHDKIEDAVENTYFGCSVCPIGFNYKIGYESQTYTSSLGTYGSVPNLSECQNKCKALACNAFSFSPSKQQCELHAKKIKSPSQAKYKDYNLCVKAEDNVCMLKDCTTYKDSRIVNGDDTAENEHPWVAFLTTATDETHLICGGALITKSIVLTVAHCQYPKSQEANAVILFGVHAKTNIKSGLISNRIQRKGLIKQMHPQEFSKPVIDVNGNMIKRGNPEKDIMLIYLDGEIQINQFIQTINLPLKSPSERLPDIYYTLYGWGAQKYCYHAGGGIDFPDAMKKTQLKVLSPDICHNTMDTAAVKNWFGYYQQYDPVDETGNNGFTQGWKMCTHTVSKLRPSIDCRGDSGSPLVYQEHGKYFVVGTASYGTDCLASFIDSGILAIFAKDLPTAAVQNNVHYYVLSQGGVDTVDTSGWKTV